MRNKKLLLDQLSRGKMPSGRAQFSPVQPKPFQEENVWPRKEPERKVFGEIKKKNGRKKNHLQQ
jgi:hypothetical protein